MAQSKAFLPISPKAGLTALTALTLLLGGCSGLERARVLEYKSGTLQSALSGAGMVVHAGEKTCALIEYRGEYGNRSTVIKNCTPEELQVLMLVHRGAPL